MHGTGRKQRSAAGWADAACRKWVGRAATAAAISAALTSALPAQESPAPRLFTHQSYVEDVLRQSALPINDTKAVFAFVLDSLPDRVKVYPTENYYYFRFVHNGSQYA